MEKTPWQSEVFQYVRPLQIIVSGMAAGCATFLVIAIVLVWQDVISELGQDTPLLTYIFIPMAVAAVAVRLLAGSAIAARARRGIIRGTWQMPKTGPLLAVFGQSVEQMGNAGKLLGVFYTRTIVGAAILEGAAFLGAIAYLLERSPLSLAAAILLILGIAVHMPHHDRPSHS